MGKTKKIAPIDPAAGAAGIKAAVVEMFDRQDGTGADWSLMVESVFRAGFEIADSQLNHDEKQAFFRRIHEGSYRRISEDGASKTDVLEAVAHPSNTGPGKSSRPAPPN